MQTFWGILRVLGGCGVTIFTLAFFVVIVLIVPMMITLRLCAFIPMSKQQHPEPRPAGSANDAGSVAQPLRASSSSPPR